MKRIISCFLAMVLIISSISLTALATSGNATYQVSSTTATQGDTVTVSVNLDNQIAGGFFNAEFLVQYDRDNLTLTDIQPGSALSGISSIGNDCFLVNLSAGGVNFVEDNCVNNITASGEIAVLTFQVHNDAPNGSYTVSLTQNTEGGLFLGGAYDIQCWFADSSYTDMGITPIISAGTITVSSEADNPTPSEGAVYANGDLTVNGAVGYGGTVAVDQETGAFTFTATQDGTYHYVLDQIFVDGVALTDSGVQKAASYTWDVFDLGEGAAGTHSVVATFAYTVNFPDPANGTLSVSRGGETLTSGSIVRGGDILTITPSPDPGYVLDGELSLTGITKNSDGTYTVTAQNGEATPAVSAQFTQAAPVVPAAPEFSVPPGAVAAGTQVGITSADAGAAIYYTTDGSEPSPVNGSVYTGPIAINAPVTLKAVAVKDGYVSEVAEAEYTVAVPAVPAAPEFSVPSGAVAAGTQVGITSADAGTVIYYTTDGSEPSPVNGSVYTGPIAINAPITLKAVAVKDGVASEAATAEYTLKTAYLYVQPGIANGTVKLEAGGAALTGASGEKPIEVRAGQTVTVTVTPAAGCRLASLAYRYSYPSDSSAAADGFAYPGVTADMLAGGVITTSFAMPDADVTVDAAFEPSGGTGSDPDSPGSGSASDWLVVEVPAETAEDGGNTTVTKAVEIQIRQTVLVTTIQSEEDLRNLALSVNAGTDYTGVTVTLTDHITLTGEWTPIGTYEAPFQGTFDGGGYTVDGLSIALTAEEVAQDTSPYYGLFGYVSEGAAIRNLTVSGKIAVTGEFESSITFYLGGVAASANDVSLLNCTSLVDIDATGGTVGGIAGSALKTTFTSCANYGSLSIAYGRFFNHSVGGILGEGGGRKNVITECVNYGAIETSCPVALNNSGKPFDDVTSCAGGLVGSASNGITIIDSCNKGSITGKAASMGGLIGRIIGMWTTSYTTVLSNCYNTGAVTFTAQNNKQNPAYIAGLVGSFTNDTFWPTLTNCYNTGTVSKLYSTGPDSGEAVYCTIGEITSLTFKTLENTYGPSDSASITAAQMGSAYKQDVNNINGGYPLLLWESETGSGLSSPVTFTVFPANAVVTVYSDSAMTQKVGTGVSFELEQGTYFYRVTAANYEEVTGSFTVTIRPVTVAVTLRQTATVNFRVVPANARFFLQDSDGNLQVPVMAANGVYAYKLYTGATYLYSAYAENYNGVTREYVVTGDGAVTVQLTQKTPADRVIYGDRNVDEKGEPLPSTIEEGGVYTIGKGGGADGEGVITINTTDAVVLVGTGTGLDDMYEDLYIDCTVSGVDLTLQNVYISNTEGAGNMINFRGYGNTLNFAGVSILDQDTGASGYAMIHVNSSTSLTVTGGTAYFYKRDQGAGIGGNGGADGGGQANETNGSITISNAVLFMKNSKQGALIGAGAQAGSKTPGPITITNSELNLIAISRGGAIGGSAGAGGASSGSTVTITNSSVNVNVDFSGAAIGGGGYDSGNDSDGGVLYVTNSSVRTYIDTNAVPYWSFAGVTEAGVNGNAAITADVYAGGKPAYLLVFDTSKLSKSAVSFTVKSGNTIVYQGGLHQWRYINEDVDVYGQASITYTIDNWTALSDPNLYLYLPGGEDVELTVNDESFLAKWDAASKSFSVEEVKTTVLTKTEVKYGVATTTVDSAALAKVLKGVQPNTQLLITAEIPEGETVYSAVTVLTHDDVVSMADAGISLNVSSPIAEIVLPNAALKDLAARWGSTVTISATEERTGVSITVAVDGKALDTVNGGLRVTLPVAKRTESTVLVQVNDDGTQTVLKDAVFGKTYVTVWVNGSCTLKVTEKPTDLLATTTVENGRATTTIESQNLAEALKNAGPNTQLVITVEIPDGESVYQSTTVISQTDAKAIAETGASLRISSPLADVGVSNTALWDLVGRNGREITITAAEQKNGTYIEAAVDGRTVSKVQDGLLVSLPVYRPTAGTVMVLVDADGSETVIKKSALGTYAVTARLEGSCTVKAVDNAKTFTDVRDSDWYAEAVAFASAHELFNGVGGAMFAPMLTMDRAMLVTVLHRLEDAPAAAAPNIFSDVPAGTWYTDAVIWANANEIVKGYGNGSFGPADSVTREQIATILYRYMQYLGLDVSARGSVNRFTDGEDTSDWAYEAVQWAVGAGIITGKDNMVLDPGGEATRAEVATMLQRLISLIVQ